MRSYGTAGAPPDYFYLKSPASNGFANKGRRFFHLRRLAAQVQGDICVVAHKKQSQVMKSDIVERAKAAVPEVKIANHECVTASVLTHELKLHT